MGTYIDLHCHFLPGIDDGVRDMTESLALVQALSELGFSQLVATPHIRPGMFDNDAVQLQASYEEWKRAAGDAPCPHTTLASEHFFDDDVYARLLAGQGLPYAALSPSQARRSVLVEFKDFFPPGLERGVRELRRRGLTMVVAHPERYRCVWQDDRCLDPLLEAGAFLLLDSCAVTGKYGSEPARAAAALLEAGAYEAACTDSHRPADAAEVARAFIELDRMVGATERERLFSAGPTRILQG